MSNTNRTALGRYEDARSAAFRGQAVPSGTWTDLAAELDEDAGICRAVHQTRLAGDMSAAARECRFRAAGVAA